MTVELIYDSDCPNVAQARTNLVKALAAAGRDVCWVEWDRSAAGSPPRVRGYGSPAILVDGKDVAGESLSEAGPRCRVYGYDGGGLAGAPTVVQISAALAAGSGTARAAAGGWRSSLAAVPGIGFALLPKLACPACWPAYAGLVSSLGAGFLLDAAYLFPLTAVLLAAAVVALAFRARRRRGYGPAIVGLVGAAAVLTGKFLFDSGPALYGGAGLLIAASLWNSWPARKGGAASPACARGPSSVESVPEKLKEASS